MVSVELPDELAVAGNTVVAIINSPGDAQRCRLACFIFIVPTNLIPQMEIP
jgi:hypothetical protein